MENNLEIIIEEHDGQSPGFGQWHIVAKMEGKNVGVYYLHFGHQEDGLLYIHDSKIVSNAPKQHIPRRLIWKCSSFLAGKARELCQTISHSVRIHHQETYDKLHHLFLENDYINQGKSIDGRYDWVMTRTYA